MLLDLKSLRAEIDKNEFIIIKNVIEYIVQFMDRISTGQTDEILCVYNINGHRIYLHLYIYTRHRYLGQSNLLLKRDKSTYKSRYMKKYIRILYIHIR